MTKMRVKYYIFTTPWHPVREQERGSEKGRETDRRREREKK